MAKIQQGDNASISKLNKLGKSMNAFKGAAKFTGWGLLTELGIAAPLAAVDYAKGANKDEIYLMLLMVYLVKVKTNNYEKNILIMDKQKTFKKHMINYFQQKKKI